MSLTYRIKRLIKSDLNALVEDLEDPRGILSQALRDMEEELERMEGAITAKESHLLKLKEGITACSETIDRLDHDIDFAINEKREEIAKSFIRKHLITHETMKAMKAEQLTCSKEHKAMEAEFKQRQEDYQRIKAECQHVNITRQDDDVFEAAGRLVPTDSTLEHQVELEFLRRIQDTKEAGHA